MADDILNFGVDTTTAIAALRNLAQAAKEASTQTTGALASQTAEIAKQLRGLASKLEAEKTTIQQALSYKVIVEGVPQLQSALQQIAAEQRRVADATAAATRAMREQDEQARRSAANIARIRTSTPTNAPGAGGSSLRGFGPQADLANAFAPGGGSNLLRLGPAADLQRALALSQQAARAAKEEAEATERIKKAREDEVAAFNRRTEGRGAAGSFSGGGGYGDSGGAGSSGGFGPDFRRGFLGAPDRGIGVSIGQAARFALVYGSMYRALNGISQAFSSSLQESIKFQDSVTQLSLLSNKTVGQVQGLADSLGKTATEQGFSASEGVRAGIKSIGVFQATNADAATQGAIARTGASQSTKFAFITGQDVNQVQENLGAVSQAFKLGADQINRVFDADLFLTQRLGVDKGAALSAIAPVAALGQKAGFSLEELTALASSIQSRLAVTPGATAGYLSQILSREGEGTIQKAFQQIGIKPGGSFADQLREAQRLIGTGQVGPNDLQTLAAAGGRGKSQDAFLAFLQSGPAVQTALAQFRQGGAGTTDKQFAELSANIGGQLRLLGGSLKQFAIEFGKSGLLDVVGAAAKAFKSLLDTTNSFLSVWNLLPHASRDVVIGLTALAIASKFGAGQFIANSITRTALANGLATGGVAGAGVRGAIANAGGREELGALGVARLGTNAVGGSLVAALGGPVGIAAIAGLVAIGSIKGSYDKHKEAMQKSSDALLLSAQANLEDADASKASAGALREAANQVQKNGRGHIGGGDLNILGLTTAKFGFDTKGDQADAVATQLRQAASNQDIISRGTTSLLKQRGGPNAYFGNFSPDDVSQALSNLALSGKSAAEIMREYNSAIDENGKVTAAAAKNSFNANLTGHAIAQGLSGYLPGALDFNISAANSSGSLINRNATDFQNQIGNVLDPVALGSELRNKIKDRGITNTKQLDQNTIADLIGPIIQRQLDRTSLSQDEKSKILGPIIQGYAERIAKDLAANNPIPDNVVKDAASAIAQLNATQGTRDNAKSQIASNDFQGFVDNAKSNLKTIEDDIRIVRKNGQTDAEIGDLLVRQRDARKDLLTAIIARDNHPLQIAAAQASATAAGTVSPLDDARASIQQAQADFDAAKANKTDDPIAYFNALGKLNSSKLAYAQAQKQEAGAIHDLLGAQVGGPLAQSISALREAQVAVNLAVTAAEKNAAQIQLLNAQGQNRDALRNFTSNVRKLASDLTNPLQSAQEEVTATLAKLNQDKARFKSGGYSKAEQDVLNQDTLDVRNARNNVTSTQFNQNLNAIQNAHDLNQITNAAYFQYLRNQESTLKTQIAGMKKTSNGYFEANQELIQIQKLQKEAADALNSQFNLGDIVLPTAYQVRSYIQNGFGNAGGPAPGGNSTQIVINGADTGTIIQILSQYMGSGNTFTVSGYN